jgi:hemolysin activation/secretion protein
MKSGKITGLTSIPLNELNFVGLRHDIPFYPDWTFIMSGNYVNANPGATLASNNINSISIDLSLGVSYQPIRQWGENLIFSAELNSRNTNGDILDDNPLTRDRIRVLRLRTDYDITDNWNGSNYISAEASKGLSILGANNLGDPNLSRAEANPDFSKFQLNASRQQLLFNNWVGIAQIAGQIASDPLFSAEEFGVGGQRFGRAYDPSELTGDHGAAGSLELRYLGLSMWEQVLFTPYGFYEHGAVWNKDRQSKRETASSAGAGIYMRHQTGFSGNVGVAWPLTREISTPIYGDGKNPRISFNVGYNF